MPAIRIYEVFRKDVEGGPFQHQGSLKAPTPELAMHYAREIYSRREEAAKLWVVPKEEIIEIADPDFLHPPIERTYRMGKAYRVSVEKRRLLREREKEAGHDAGA